MIEHKKETIRKFKEDGPNKHKEQIAREFA